MFTTIILTPPRFVPGEAERIAGLLRSGRADLVHLRKPASAEEDMERLILSLPHELRPCLTLHDHLHLALRHGLGGVHLNGRCPACPEGFAGRVSRSCHTLGEVERLKERYDFVSLSPVFRSISKPGYMPAFTDGEIEQAAAAGVIDDRVFALGGVRFSSIPLVKSMGFGGAMVLGEAWRDLALQSLT